MDIIGQLSSRSSFGIQTELVPVKSDFVLILIKDSMELTEFVVGVSYFRFIREQLFYHPPEGIPFKFLYLTGLVGITDRLTVGVVGDRQGG